ncbi:cobyric acid synthase [Corynebacterium capitovis DSM 44611]|uniref:type 1 glutamine amidotransferase n=1 Tax=Corynebacterium capitovis TaxID=131081 RepID=UPI00036C828D|nr:glutamine amidotransferase [Corynebacterium capitovis]WKD56692.1 cobyric acid synthase [Corynebacterium capitovis DSM 44611]
MPKGIRIGLILPDVLGTYGDDGNALVLRQRARMRGVAAEIERITLNDDVPADCDVYTLGGGEDSAQVIAAARLAASPGLQAAVADGRPVFAVCAGMQVLGHTFTAHGETVEGIGLIDATTTPMSARAIGEVASTPSHAGVTAELTEPLTGFENHMGGTLLGPDASPLAKITRGVGNVAGSAVEGVVQGSVVATYMHGPALARNPQLADLLLARALGMRLSELEPLELPVIDRLRMERLAG